MVWSSVVVLGYAAAYGVGTWRAWPALSGRTRGGLDLPEAGAGR